MVRYFCFQICIIAFILFYLCVSKMFMLKQFCRGGFVCFLLLYFFRKVYAQIFVSFWQHRLRSFHIPYYLFQTLYMHIVFSFINFCLHFCLPTFFIIIFLLKGLCLDLCVVLATESEVFSYSLLSTSTFVCAYCIVFYKLILCIYNKNIVIYLQ